MNGGSVDPEVSAMAGIADLLDPLNESERRRVLSWAFRRFAGEEPNTDKAESTTQRARPDGAGDSAASSTVYESFPDLFDAANPRTGLERVLVAGYWFQELNGEESLDSYQLNKELKNLGHPSTNITRDLTTLMNRTPRLIIQTRKEGKSKQARKKYRLTREGVREVQRMLRDG